jgi:hypothetical protein
MHLCGKLTINLPHFLFPFYSILACSYAVTLLVLFFYSIFLLTFSFFDSMLVWMKDFILARQSLSCWTIPPALFVLVIQILLFSFSNRVLHFCSGWLGQWFFYLCFHLPRMTGVCYHTPLIGWDGLLQTFFCLQ